MVKQITVGERFEKYRSALQRDCQRAFSSWVIYKQLENYIHTHNEVVNLAPGFFQNCRANFKDHSLLILAKILDKGSRGDKNLSIYYYLFFIENNHGVFSKVPKDELIKKIEKDRAILTGCSRTINGIVAWRNATIAHTSAGHVTAENKIYDSMPIVVGDVDNLFEQIENIISRYSIYFDGLSTSFYVMGTKDLSRVIELMEKGRATELHEIEEIT